MWMAALGVALFSCAPRQDQGFHPEVPSSSLRASSGGGGPSSHGDPLLPGQPNAPGGPSDARLEGSGLATWYGAQFAGKKTASGERFDPDALTAAHRTLPFGTWVEVRRTSGASRVVRVRINDRGPFGDPKRIIDLSRKAAQELDMTRDGVVSVELRVVSGPN